MTDKEEETGHPESEFNETILTRMRKLSLFEMQVLLAPRSTEQAASHICATVTTVEFYRKRLEREYGFDLTELTRHVTEFRRRRRVRRVLWVRYVPPRKQQQQVPLPNGVSPKEEELYAPLTERGVERRAQLMLSMSAEEMRLINGWLEGSSYMELAAHHGLPPTSVSGRFSGPKGIFALLDLPLKRVDSPQDFRKKELRLIRDRCIALKVARRLEPA
jgi:hypothetical protein